MERFKYISGATTLMDTQILAEAESQLKRVERLGKFSHKYGVFHQNEARKLFDDLKRLDGQLKENPAPQTRDELVESEFKRAVRGNVRLLEHNLEGRYHDFSTVLSIYGIPEEDISDLRPWLDGHVEEARATIDRLFKERDVKDYELDLPFDIPSVRREAEEVAAHHIANYSQNLGKLIEKITAVGHFLRDIRTVPSAQARSYFSYLMNNTLALGIPAILFMRKGKLCLNERELIRLYGHEGMGHALQEVITKAAKDLPYIIRDGSALTIASQESATQFYEGVIFDDLRNSPETLRELDLDHKFGDIYREEKDTRIIERYQRRFHWYAITVLADKALGDPKERKTIDRKVELLKPVALGAADSVVRLVERHRDNFDSQGNLDFGVACEIRYSAQPVERALRIFAANGIHYEGQGRSIIDRTFLEGYFTPAGFIENARLKAKECITEPRH